MIFLGQLPPPCHGAAVMNLKSLNLFYGRYLYIRTINLSRATSLDDVGAISFLKILKILFLYIKIIIVLVRFRPKSCYFAFCPSGAAYYRDVIIASILKLFRIKIIYHLHGRGLKNGNRWIKFKLNKFVFSNSDVIHLSHVFWQELDGFINKERFWVVPNCAEDLAECTRSRGHSEPVNFFYFSNFVRGKGVLYLLEAAKQLYREGINCRITLAGGWSDLQLKEEIEEWKKRNSALLESGFVDFRGPLLNQDRIEFIREGDVMVFPSYIDTFPLVVLESLSAGKPVIASATGAVPEILADGECGLIFPEHDIDALLAGMKAVVDDRALLELLGSAARARYVNFYREDAYSSCLLGVLDEIKAREV